MIKKFYLRKSINFIAASILLTSLSVESATLNLLDDENFNNPFSPLHRQLDNPNPIDHVDQQDLKILTEGYLMVINLLKEQKFSEAEKKTFSLLSSYPKQPELYNLQGLVYVFQTKTELAILSYQKTISLDNENLKAHLALSKILLDQGKLNEAKEHASKALTIDDKSIYAYLLFADIAYKQGNPEETENTLLSAKKKFHGEIRQELIIAHNLGKLYVIQGMPERMLAEAELLIERYPTDSATLAYLASAQLINKQEKLAKSTLFKITNQDQQDIKHRFLLVRLLISQSEEQKTVLKLLDEISSIAPENIQTLSQVATYLTKLQKYQKAQQIATKIKKLAPHSGLGQIVEAKVYLAKKSPDQALESFQKAYMIKPTDQVLSVIVDLMVANGKTPEAISFLNKELIKNERNIVAHLKLAEIYDTQNNLTKAEIHYKAILREAPENSAILNNLAWTYYQQNNSEALKFSEQAYKLTPQSAPVVDTYGLILIQQGNHTKGIKILEKAVKLDPTNLTIQLHLAQAYYSNGRNKTADKLLRSILNTQQNFSEKDEAISLLNKINEK